MLGLAACPPPGVDADDLARPPADLGAAFDLAEASDLRGIGLGGPVTGTTLAFVAGGLGGYGEVDDIARAARFRAPYGMALDGAGTLYVADYTTVRKVVLAINKMDQVDFAQDVFDTLVRDYLVFARQAGIGDVQAIPMSALLGDNIVERSDRTPWYGGLPLLEYLETVQVEQDRGARPFRMPVQWVNRPNLDFRGFAGQVASGTIGKGDAVRILPSGKASTISRIVTLDGDIDSAVAGQSVTI